MFQKLDNIKHIKENNTTYFSHMKRAILLSLKAGFASVALLIHSVFPNVFEKTGSNTIHKLHKELFPVDKKDD